jgi:CRISPR/Cas system CMR-associated protein Cmr5 small subunit
MQNLDQIRAAAANELCTKSEFFRSDVAGFPSLIINNGLLSATAFAIESGREQRKGISAAVEGLAKHLGNPAHGIEVIRGVASSADLIRKLSDRTASSLDLQRATTEALAFFSYVKRFAQKKAK